MSCMCRSIGRGGGVGGPDPIPGKSQVLSNSIEISILTPLVNSWTPPRIPGKFWTKKPKNKHKKIKAVFFSPLGLDLPPPPPPPPWQKNLDLRMHWPFNSSSPPPAHPMVMSVPWLNYPLTIEALTGGGGGGWYKLACSPKIENLFSWVPCSPTFSLFACSPQKLHLPPLFPWNKCPFTLFPKTHGRPQQLLTYTQPSILLLLLCLLFQYSLFLQG